MSTEEGNKLIEKFNHPEYSINGDWILKNDEVGTRYHVSVLQYHTSWDWLMPVVEKIEKIHDDFHGYFGVHIYSNSCTIQGTNLRTDPENFHPAYMSDPNLICETKIESTWYNILQFIQWYNKTTKQ